MKILLLLLFTISLTNCSSQSIKDVNGKLYMINKSGFVEITITKDSLFNQKLFSNFSPKRSKKRAVEIAERVHLKDRLLLLGESPKSKSEFQTIMTLVPSEKKSAMKLIWNGIDSISSVKTITKLNETDQRRLFGYDLYSRDQLESLKEKKPIEDMNLEDFKKYLEVYSQNLKVTAPEFRKNMKASYGAASSFNYQISISSLLAIGYNPIQTSKAIDVVFAKYIENEEVKELLRKLKEGK